MNTPPDANADCASEISPGAGAIGANQSGDQDGEIEDAEDGFDDGKRAGFGRNRSDAR